MSSDEPYENALQHNDEGKNSVNSDSGQGMTTISTKISRRVLDTLFDQMGDDMVAMKLIKRNNTSSILRYALGHWITFYLKGRQEYHRRQQVAAEPALEAEKAKAERLKYENSPLRDNVNLTVDVKYLIDNYKDIMAGRMPSTPPKPDNQQPQQHHQPQQHKKKVEKQGYVDPYPDLPSAEELIDGA